jgi:hypothetical protein
MSNDHVVTVRLQKIFFLILFCMIILLGVMMVFLMLLLFLRLIYRVKFLLSYEPSRTEAPVDEALVWWFI